MRLVAGAALLLAACGHPDGARPAPPAPSAGSDVVAPAPPVPVDAPEATQEERLAAIQKAMNELDEAVQACWAAVAVERFDVEGEIVPLIEIEKGTAKTTYVSDTVRNPKLAACASNTRTILKYCDSAARHSSTWAVPPIGLISAMLGWPVQRRISISASKSGP